MTEKHLDVSCYFDGSYSDAFHSTYGFVAFSRTQMIGRGCGRANGTSSSEIEWQAALRLAHWIRQHCLRTSRILFKGDCQEVIKALKHKRRTSNFSTIRDEIIATLRPFRVYYLWVPRTDNKVAHHACRIGRWLLNRQNDNGIMVHDNQRRLLGMRKRRRRRHGQR